VPNLDLKYFEILKKEVVKTLQKNYSVGSEIEKWKRQEILNLQDDLLEKVNGRISEKWFYTHLKSETTKLPRIDMLNILCEYAGYKNWNDLKSSFEVKPNSTPPKSKKKPLVVVVIILLLAVVFVGSKFFPQDKEYKFCFVDANLKAPIKNSPIWVVLLNNNESPMVMKCDSNGCFSFETKDEQIQFVVRSPYYKTDTITRIVHNKSINEEQIQLKTNDYALMIHLFSKSKVTNWRKRRKQLGQMLTNDARIYQVYDDGITGMELYNKQEFINKLTTPTKSLKSIEIIETIYTGDQISIMRFKQNEKPN
jgi:hypothetical protein